MPHIDIDGKNIKLNDEGCLANFEDWDEEVAKTLAQVDKLTLTACHWVALRFLREYYMEYQMNPSPRTVVRTVGEKLTAGKCSIKTLDELFPLGGCKQASRLAGLPHYYRHACY